MKKLYHLMIFLFPSSLRLHLSLSRPSLNPSETAYPFTLSSTSSLPWPRIPCPCTSLIQYPHKAVTTRRINTALRNVCNFVGYVLWLKVNTEQRVWAAAVYRSVKYTRLLPGTPWQKKKTARKGKRLLLPHPRHWPRWRESFQASTQKQKDRNGTENGK